MWKPNRNNINDVAARSVAAAAAARPPWSRPRGGRRRFARSVHVAALVAVTAAAAYTSLVVIRSIIVAGAPLSALFQSLHYIGRTCGKRINIPVV